MEIKEEIEAIYDRIGEIISDLENINDILKNPDVDTSIFELNALERDIRRIWITL